MTVELEAVRPPVVTTSPIPAVASARELLSSSFELLLRSGEDMRRASFYIGTIALGTLGPAGLVAWAAVVLAPGSLELLLEAGSAPIGEPTDPAILAVGLPLGLLFALATAGIVVATVESRTIAAAVLGARLVGGPLTTRQAVARARASFWRSFAAAIIVAIPIVIVQAIVDEALKALAIPAEQVSIVSAAMVTAVVGAPFAYVLAGVVLGDVGALEAVKRSVRVFRARKLAAAIVAGFETVTALLLLFGLGAGVDVIARLLGVLGLGPESDALGLAIVAVAIVAGAFAFGTLLYTVYAITVAPQVVMFVSLTHASMGLDRVRAGGIDDPEVVRPGRARFRWLTRPMQGGFVLGGLGLVAALAILRG